ncbi:MAG: ribosome recycling factor [Eubacteriales bacterium]|nr:ribosome recycling factor [Eubacteriales bacterium]
MAIELNAGTYKPYEERMQASIRVLEDQFNTIRAGRANPRLLDSITVEYYGVPSPLQQVANIQVPEARLMTITPWDSSMLKEIERALQASDLGINPMNDGKLIRLAFPQLTEERRIELTKDVNKLGEETKVAIRNIRRDGIDTFRGYQKNGEVREDDLYAFEEEMQKLTDKYVGKVDKAVENKNKELMEL